MKLFTGKNCNFPWSSIRQSRHSTRSIPANFRLAAEFFPKCCAGLVLMLALQPLFFSERCRAAGAESPLSGLVLHGPRDRAQIALTFDLCQVPGRPAGFDEEIVSILEQQQLAATFFAGGDWMRTHPAAIRRLAANPRFEIGNHSWSHPDLRKLSREQIGAEVRRTLAELERLTGRTTRLFRLPFGYAEQQTLQVLNDLGQRIIQWDLVTGDPDPGVLADNIVATVKTRAHNGSILIMHANGRGHHTAEALPLVIEALRARGFSFATISGLLGAPVADSARFRAGP